MADDLIRAFVQELRAELPEPIGRWADGGNTRRRMVRQVMRCLGSERINRVRLSELDGALKDASVFVDRPLGDDYLLPRDRVRFSKAPFRPEEILFGKEANLKELVQAQIGNVAPFKSFVLLRPEAPLADGSRLDLLCEDRQRGAGKPLVVIELKKAGSGDRLATQIKRYVDALRVTDRYRNRKVRVIVIASEVDQATTAILSAMDVEVQMLRYRIAFESIASA